MAADATDMSLRDGMITVVSNNNGGDFHHTLATVRISGLEIALDSLMFRASAFLEGIFAAMPPGCRPPVCFPRKP